MEQSEGETNELPYDRLFFLLTKSRTWNLAPVDSHTICRLEEEGGTADHPRHGWLFSIIAELGLGTAKVGIIAELNYQLFMTTVKFGVIADLNWQLFMPTMWTLILFDRCWPTCYNTSICCRPAFVKIYIILFLAHLEGIYCKKERTFGKILMFKRWYFSFIVNNEPVFHVALSVSVFVYN